MNELINNNNLILCRNSRIIRCTFILTTILSHSLTSPSPLIDAILTFLQDDGQGVSLLSLLVSRINHPCTDVAIASMQLLDVMLKSCHPIVITHLLPSLPPNQSTKEMNVSTKDYIAAFAECFSDPLPYSKFSQISQDSTYLLDAEYLAAMTAECATMYSDRPAIPSGDQEFVNALLIRVGKIMRQPTKVNLFLTQLVTTLATIVPGDLLVWFFLDHQSSISFSKEVSKVGGRDDALSNID